MPEPTQAQSNAFLFDQQKAKKVLQANLANLIRKVGSGKPLTKWERELVAQVAGPSVGDNLPVIAPTFATSQLQLAKILGIPRQRLNYRFHQPGNPGRQPNGTYYVPAWREWLTSIGVALGEADSDAAAEDNGGRPQIRTDYGDALGAGIVAIGERLRAALEAAGVKLKGRAGDSIVFRVWLVLAAELDGMATRQGFPSFFEHHPTDDEPVESYYPEDIRQILARMRDRTHH